MRKYLYINELNLNRQILFQQTMIAFASDRIMHEERIEINMLIIWFDCKLKLNLELIGFGVIVMKQSFVYRGAVWAVGLVFRVDLVSLVWESEILMPNT